MAEVAVLGVFFEHPFTGVNGVGKRDQAWGWGSGSPSGNSFPRSSVGMTSQRSALSHAQGKGRSASRTLLSRSPWERARCAWL